MMYVIVLQKVKTISITNHSPVVPFGKVVLCAMQNKVIIKLVCIIMLTYSQTISTYI